MRTCRRSAQPVRVPLQAAFFGHSRSCTLDRVPVMRRQSAVGFWLPAGYDSSSEETLLATLQSISVAELETLLCVSLEGLCASDLTAAL